MEALKPIPWESHLKCKCEVKEVLLIQYGYMSKNHYDGVSEVKCLSCNRRWGRWTKRELFGDEEEHPYGFKRLK